MDFEPLDRNYPMKGVEAIDTEVLDTFPYEYPQRPIDLEISTDEFTSICPFSGLPDFGTITIQYVPDKLCVELRSLKYYLLSYRHVGMYYEHVVNRILEDLAVVCKPIKMTIIADYTPRGGLKTKAVAKWEAQSNNIYI